jgi:serine/threonine protein kinase
MSLAISSVEAIEVLVINSTVTTKIVRDPHTNKEYYLKIFKDRSMLDADQFIYPYLRLKNISHDNITKVLDMVINITTFEEPLRVLMDHYSEPNLENQINIRKRTKEKWTERQLLDYARQLISACAFMQEKNISDLSLSPSKIFITENGKIIKIREFGYDIYNDIQRDNYRSSQNNYLFSPEQIKSVSSDDLTQIKQLDHFKCEVYILGLILLQMALLIELPSISQLHKFLPELKKLYPKLGNLICLMLSNNIEERPDLSALLDKLKLQAQKCGRCCRNVIEEDLKSLLNSKVCSDCFELLKSIVVRCHHCKELKNIREVYQSDEICCFVCIRKLVFHHDRM